MSSWSIPSPDTPIAPTTSPRLPSGCAPALTCEISSMTVCPTVRPDAVTACWRDGRRPVPYFGRDPATIGNIQSNNPGETFENLIILGSAPGEGYMSAPGDIRAYDVSADGQRFLVNVPSPSSEEPQPEPAGV